MLCICGLSTKSTVNGPLYRRNRQLGLFLSKDEGGDTLQHEFDGCKTLEIGRSNHNRIAIGGGDISSTLIVKNFRYRLTMPNS